MFQLLLLSQNDFIFFLTEIKLFVATQNKMFILVYKLLGNAHVDRDNKTAVVVWETQIMEGTRPSDYTYH